MRTNEAAFLLGVSKEQLKEIIETGAKLPKSGDVVKLAAKMSDGEYMVEDADLDAYIKRFEDEEPGRNPPVAVRRTLLVEANHRCAICRQPVARIQFHHILEWEKVKHHDPKHMMAVCGLCHDDCGIGRIDKDSQWRYKAKLQHPEYRAEAPDAEASKVKRERDIETLMQLFSQLHTGVTDRFLDEAAYGYVLYDFSTIFWEGFNAVVSSANFYLYDETAWQMIRDFHASVAVVLSFDRWMSLTGPRDKLKWDERYISHPEWHRDLEVFREHAALADSAYRKLYAYIREKYLEVDFKKTNAAAWEDYKKYRSDVR